jgi:hypothetical protein
LLFAALAGCGTAPATPVTPRHDARSPIEVPFGPLHFGSTLDELEHACANANGSFWTEASAAGGCHPVGVSGSGIDAFCDAPELSAASAERPVFIHVYYDPSRVATMATLRVGPNHPQGEVDAIWEGVFRAMGEENVPAAREGAQVVFQAQSGRALRLRASETVHATEITLELFRSRSLVCS